MNDAVSRSQVKRPEGRPSPSQHIFQTVLAYQAQPQPLDDEAYAALLKTFFSQLLLLNAKHELAADREGEYGFDDPFIVNVILTEALRDQTALSQDDHAFIQSIFLDDRFFIALSFLSTWGLGGDPKPLSDHFVDLPGMSAEDKLAIIMSASKTLFEMIGAQFYECGHWGYDLVSIIVSREPNPINRLHHFNIFYRIQSYVDYFQRFIDWNAVTCDMPDEDDGQSREFVQHAKDFAETHFPFVQYFHQMMGSFVVDRVHDIQLTIAKHIMTVDGAYHSYAMNSELEYDALHWQTLEDIVYSDLFSKDSPLRQYDEDTLGQFFYHLLYTLHNISDGLDNASIKNDLADTYAGADKGALKDIRKTRMLESLREHYFILLGLASGVSNLSDAAKQVAGKFQAHLALIKQLESSEPKESETDSLASFQSFESERETLRRNFFHTVRIQRQINAAVYEKLHVYRRLITEARGNVSAFLADLYQDDHFNASRDEVKLSIDMENKRLRNNLRDLAQQSSSQISVINRDTVLTSREKQRAIKKILQAPTELLYDSFVVELTKGLPIDIRYRLYLDALYLEKGALKKSIVQLNTMDESGERVLAIQQRKLLFEKKVAVLKAQYHIDEEPISASLPVIDSEFEFNDQCELDVPKSREETLGLVATRLIDTENRRRWQATQRTRCLRNESRYQAHGKQLANRQRLHTDDPSYQRIIARYDPGVARKLRRAHSEAQQRSLARTRRNWRYAGFAVLAVIGVVGIAAATIVTLGVVHLAWIIPAVYFAVGGVCFATGSTGLVLNKPSRYQSVKRWLHKGRDSIKSILGRPFHRDHRSVECAAPVQRHEPSNTNDQFSSPSITARQTSLRVRSSPREVPIRHTREAGDSPIMPVDPEFKPRGKARDVYSQSARAQQLLKAVSRQRESEAARPDTASFRDVIKAMKDFRNASGIWESPRTFTPDEDDDVKPVFNH